MFAREKAKTEFLLGFRHTLTYVTGKYEMYLSLYVKSPVFLARF